ncbi:LysR family transcriptional regulator [Salinisphaera dokdonensis CL-ES53]|uniref:LysR family transcriptional regulator n=1 Tax=Salinisphaera dokdonensis CL-ES53 TaxID=1304272 RepID=A0ABV2AYI6_9GAMM
MLNPSAYRQLDIDLLRTFQLACQLGTLRAVAERRHFTLGAVSQQIKRLETLLDRRLLERGRQGVTPTADGLKLQADSSAVLAAHDDLIDRLANRSAGGRVRLGLPEVYAPRLLTPLLPRLRRAHPDLSLQVCTGASGSLRRALDNGELDLAVIVAPVDADHRGTPLWRTRPVWATGASMPAPGPGTLPLALHPPDCPYRALGLDALETEGRAWEDMFTSESMAAIEAAVAAGVAVGILDRDRLGPDVRELTSRDGLPRLPDCFASIVIADSRRDTDAEAIRAVADALAATGLRSSQRSAATTAVSA